MNLKLNLNNIPPFLNLFAFHKMLLNKNNKGLALSFYYIFWLKL